MDTNNQEFYDHFLREVEKHAGPQMVSGCIPWNGGRDLYGYGHFYYKRQKLKVHRVMYEAKMGKIPAGKKVIHRCENPWCMAISHLTLGHRHPRQKEVINVHKEAQIWAKNNKVQGTIEETAQLFQKFQDQLRNDIMSYLMSAMELTSLLKDKRYVTFMFGMLVNAQTFEELTTILNKIKQQ